MNYSLVDVRPERSSSSRTTRTNNWAPRQRPMFVVGISCTKPKTRAFVTERTWAYQTKSAFSDTGYIASWRLICNGYGCDGSQGVAVGRPQDRAGVRTASPEPVRVAGSGCWSRSPQSRMLSSTGASDWPSSVSSYSTFGGTSGNTVLLDDPVRFELAQLQGDHPRCGRGRDAAEGVEAQLAVQQMKDQDRLPDAADHRERRLDRAAGTAGLPLPRSAGGTIIHDTTCSCLCVLPMPIVGAIFRSDKAFARAVANAYGGRVRYGRHRISWASWPAAWQHSRSCRRW